MKHMEGNQINNFLKTRESESPKPIINSNGEILTNLIDIANSFHNVFLFCYTKHPIHY